MGVELVFVACLMALPDWCHQERRTYAGSLAGCVLSVRQPIAEWNDQNPGWQTRTWRCGTPSTDA